jgi:hypothetical protein
MAILGCLLFPILPSAAAFDILPILLQQPQHQDPQQLQRHILASLHHQHHQQLHQLQLQNTPSLFVSTDNVAAVVLSNNANDGATAISTLSSSFPSFTFLADAEAAANAIVESTSGGGGVLEIVQTVALGITAVLFLLAGLTYLTASVLIPAGAQQLELECQQIIPETWNEYLQKLQKDETIQDRPDLMFELGLLLNKAKADQLERLCQQQTTEDGNNNMDLWNDYQSKLQDGQALQDRPDLIQKLSMELGERATRRIQNNCPPELWRQYQAKLELETPGQTMAQRQDLLAQIVQEPQYQALFDATQGKGVVDVDVDVDAVPTSTSKGTATPAKSQWDDEDEDA